MDVDSLKSEIQHLEKLQEIDLEIFEIDKKLREIPDILSALKNKIEELHEQIEQDKTTYKEAERWQKEHERAIEMQKDLLAKSKAKLAASRNEREANAAQREIDTIKRALNEREEEAIHIMEVIEQTTESIRQKDERYHALQSEFEGMEQESRKKASGMEDSKVRLGDERKQLLKTINHRNLDLYEKIRTRKPRAIVPAIKGICQGCHMMLPPQTYNILLRSDRLIQCPNCHRIVYCTDKEICSLDGSSAK
jgi:predicted  nucleic acid-binding Zn-ribbon protein